MEPTALTDITVQGSLGGTKVGMTFDENSLAHLMSVLTDLYSDKEMAVLREYSTNALDAHVEAGIKRPIEVTLPSTLSPNLVIRDYGVGLSVNDLTEIYSKYGASTKRGTNEQVGMLGLGCKSALTYTPNFTLTSVKNGIKVLASISRIEDGTGSIEIVDTSATDEPNGTTVTVPTQRYNSFAAKAAQFFGFWQEGDVLVNGESPVDREGWSKISESIYLVPNLTADYIVMGNVAYETNERIYTYSYSHGIVAFVPIGVVNFTPSREKLHYTKKTIDTVKAVKKELHDSLRKAVENEVNAAKTHGEAMGIYLRWRNSMNYNFQSIISGMSYKDTPFPGSLKGQAWKYTPNGRPLVQSYDSFSYRDLENGALLIRDFDVVGVSRTHRQKIDLWAEDNGIDFSRAFIAKEPFGAPWTDDLKWYSWDDIKETKINRNPRAPRDPAAPKEPGYDTWFLDGTFKVTDDIPKDAEIIYYSSAEMIRSTRVYWETLRDAFPSAIIVRMPKNRWEKFTREHPKAVHFRRKIAEISNISPWAGLNDDDQFYLANREWNGRWLTNLDPAQISDPDLVKAINILKGGESQRIKDGKRRAATLYNLGILYNTRVPVDSEYAEKFKEKYPMAYSNQGAPKTHVYAYINMVFKEKI